LSKALTLFERDAAAADVGCNVTPVQGDVLLVVVAHEPRLERSPSETKGIDVRLEIDGENCSQSVTAVTQPPRFDILA
jgi:hypothetical protein